MEVTKYYAMGQLLGQLVGCDFYALLKGAAPLVPHAINLNALLQ